MFDIAFSEILVIAVVALVVLGPEKLPKTARTIGHLYGRLRRYVNEVQADITREMELDELRKLRQQVQSAAREIETSVSATVQDMESNVRSLEAELNRAAALGDAPAEPTPSTPAAGPGASAATPAPLHDGTAAPEAAPNTPAAAPGQSAATPAPAHEASAAAEPGAPKQQSLPGLEQP